MMLAETGRAFDLSCCPLAERVQMHCVRRKRGVRS